MRFSPIAVIALATVAAADPANHYDYEYPAQARAIAPLRAWLETAKTRGRAKFAAEALADQREAKENGYPYRKFDAEYEWQVVTDTPRFLSLSLTVSEFTGGAHGNTSYDALLWDKAAGARMKPDAVFANPKAFYASVRAQFCDAIDRERSRRREEKVVRGEGLFDDCIDPAKEVLILGSSGGGKINRVGFLIAPYNAGSYAEGSYEVTLPVTQSILAKVKPQYRAAFAVAR